MSARKLTALSINDKVKIIKKVESSAEKKKDIAAQFGIPANTLSTILKNKDLILKKYDANQGGRKRIKSAEFSSLEQCVVKWLKQCRDQNIPISGNLLKEKALEFGKDLNIPEFRASNGWLEKFKKRNDIAFKKICGESASVNHSVCTDWIRKLQDICKDYGPDDIFNIDETALFFKCLPDKTMTLKGDLCKGGKNSKERVTLMLGSNISGNEKLTPLIIGKTAKPRCFSGIKSFPLDYENNKKAWMTGEIFSKWIRKLDRTMTSQKRKIIVFLDNAASHTYLELSSIKLEFLPANTTSILQPLDQGIIQSFKCKYRKIVVQKCLADIEEGRKLGINLLEAMRIADTAWRSVSSQTIRNCFKKAGFPTSLTCEPFSTDNTNECDLEIWTHITENMSLPSNLTFSDYVAVDDNVAVCGVLSDSEILAEVTTINVPSDSSDEKNVLNQLQNRVTNKEASQAVTTIRNFLETQSGISDKTFEAISHIEAIVLQQKFQNSRQSTLERYF